MNPPPNLPILSLLLLLLPALPVQAWFVRLLSSSSAHRQTQTRTKINPFFFLFAQTELRPRLPQQRRRPLSRKWTWFSSEVYLSSCTFFFFSFYTYTKKRIHTQRKKTCRKADVDFKLYRMENVCRMEMDVRRIRMSLGNMGRRRGVRIRSREDVRCKKEDRRR